MSINIIVSIAKNNVIGKDNTLLWKQSADLKRFKKLTSGHPVIMGQKTYESIGKPLPDRTNIVLTEDPNFQAIGCYIAKSIEESMEICIKYSYQDEIFIIGGGSIYRQFLPLADKLYVTIIDAEPDGDTYFPEINIDIWKPIYSEQHFKDNDNQYGYTYLIYEKR